MTAGGLGVELALPLGPPRSKERERELRSCDFDKRRRYGFYFKNGKKPRPIVFSLLEVLVKACA